MDATSGKTRHGPRLRMDLPGSALPRLVDRDDQFAVGVGEHGLEAAQAAVAQVDEDLSP